MWYLIAAVTIWASSLIAGKFSYESFDPALTVQFRLLISALLLLPLFKRNYRRVPPHLRLKVWLLAMMNLPLVLNLQFIGLYYTSAASASTIVGMEPLLVVFIGRLCFGQQAKPIDWLLSMLAFIGIALVVLGGGDEGEISVWGCFLVLLAEVIFALCLYLGKSVMKEIEPRVYTNCILVLGALLCLPFTLLFTRDWQITPTFNGIAAVLYLAVACTWFAMLLFNKGLQQVSANVSGILITLEPVFGVLLAVLILGESFSLISGIGMALVMAATFLSVSLPMLVQRLRRRTP